MVELSIVVPVYNEEKNIRPFVEQIEKVMETINKNYELIFVLDPSKDDTENAILEEIKKNKNIKLIVLSRKFGQPAATVAGIENCNGNYCVIIDVDLQDPPNLIGEMYTKITSEKLDVVYAKRRSRKGETPFKKFFSKIGYETIHKLSDVKIPKNVGDFRIISRRIIDELKKLKESHGFLRGLVSFVGFKQGYILFDRDERFSGESKYNKFFGSLKIGINGLVSFSSKPLFIMSLSGFILAVLSFLLGIWYLFQKITGIDITPGLTTTVILLSFYSGIQLLGLGLLGEYIGRIYEEVKQRPKYIMDKKINFQKSEEE